MTSRYWCLNHLSFCLGVKSLCTCTVKSCWLTRTSKDIPDLPPYILAWCAKLNFVAQFLQLWHVYQYWFEKISSWFILWIVCASAFSFLWWLYDADTTWCMHRYLQKSWNFSETKFVLVLDIYFPGSPYSVKIIIHVFIRKLARKYTRPNLHTMYGNNRSTTIIHRQLSIRHTE